MCMAVSWRAAEPWHCVTQFESNGRETRRGNGEGAASVKVKAALTVVAQTAGLKPRYGVEPS